MIERDHRIAGLALAAFVSLLAACGGSESDLAASTDAARGGGAKIPASPASLAITPGTVSLGQTVTISLYPGSYAGDRLFVNWTCYQNGAAVSHDGTYEFHDAVTYQIPGYTFLGDHYDWQFTFEPLQNYTGGAANCDVIASYVNRKSQWIQIAAASFAAQ
jgi:hypothetical protein